MPEQVGADFDRRQGRRDHAEAGNVKIADDLARQRGDQVGGGDDVGDRRRTRQDDRNLRPSKGCLGPKDEFRTPDSDSTVFRFLSLRAQRAAPLTPLSLQSGGDAVGEADIQALVHEHPACLPIAEIDPIIQGPAPTFSSIRLDRNPK